MATKKKHKLPLVNENGKIECADCKELHEELNKVNTNGKFICESCNENYFNCDECDKKTLIDEGNSHNYKHYCKKCYDDNFSSCDDCSDIDRADDFHYINDRNICTSCYNDNYFCCESCNEYYHNDNYAGEGHCNSCWDDSSNSNSLRSNTYKPEPKFFKLNSESKFFGIELEVEQKDSDIDIDDMVEKIKIENIYFKSDGSLSNGMEIVTHPHSYEYLKKNKQIFENIINTLKDNHYSSYNTTTCGIHIHITKNAFNTWHLYRFMKFFADNKGFILKISQRKEEQLKQWAKLDELTQAKLMNKAKTKFENNDRYQAINLCNSNTIEIRIFRGTLHIESFYKNIEFLESLYQFTINCESKNVNLTNYLSFILENKKVYNNLFEWLAKKDFYKATKYTVKKEVIEHKKSAKKKKVKVTI